MCTTREETLGKGVPSIAQSIISKCSRTWSQERRISVLHRTLKPRISVWDCVPEHIVDTQLRDTFEYLPEQRNYLLDHATPASAVVRSIRRLDGHQSSPLVLNSPRFDSEGEVDADHCAQGSGLTLEFSESDFADDRTISRASTPSPTAISEYEDGHTHSTLQDEDLELEDHTHSTPQDEDLESEDEAGRGKAEQWISYSESENVKLCSSSEQSDSDVDDEAFSPEPRELFTIYESDEDVEDDEQYDEPAEANSPEPRELFTIYESDEDDVEDNQQYDEPVEANSPEPRELSIIYECDEDVEDNQQYDEPVEANSPEPRELSIIYECDEDVEDDQQYDEPAEANSPEPQQLPPVHQSHLESDSDHQNDEPLEAESPEPRRLSHFRLESPVADYDGEEKDDDLFEAESPAPRRLFPVHQSHSTLYDPPQPAPQTESFCPAPLRRFLEPEEMLKFDAFNDWFVHMHMNRYTAIDMNPEKSISGTPSPEPRRLFSFRHTSPVPTYGDGEKDDDPSRAESPAPRRLFPVYQSHPTVYDPPQSAPQMETFCPAPLRRFLEPEEILKFDEFEDWFVRMSERSSIDASSEPRKLFPLRHESPVREHDGDEKDDDPSRAESPAPRRLFPVHQSHSTVYDPPQSAPQMETFCPAPLRRFLEPEEILKFDAFNDWFVNMHMRRNTAIDASPGKSISETPSPEPRRLFPFRHTSPVPVYGDVEKEDDPSEAESPAPRRLFTVHPVYGDDENEDVPFEAESPAPRRLFPVYQSHSAVYDPPHPAPQMESFCPAPLRRFLEPEEILKFDAFEDWFVRMHMSKHTAIDASPEPRRLIPLRHESPVPKCDNNENFYESFEVESPEPRRFFPVRQSHSWLNEPNPVLECDDEAFERMEFIPVKSLRL